MRENNNSYKRRRKDLRGMIMNKEMWRDLGNSEDKMFETLSLKTIIDSYLFQNKAICLADRLSCLSQLLAAMAVHG